VLDLACPALDAGESRRGFWILAFTGMTNSPQAAGNIIPRDSTDSAISSPFENLRVIGKSFPYIKCDRALIFN